MKLIETVLATLQDFVSPAPAPETIDAPRGRGAKVVAVRNDYKLETMPGPERSRRTHKFHDLRSFAEWLTRWADPKKAEILVGLVEAKAVLDDDARASLVACGLIPHPLFAAWHKAFGVKKTPRELLAFIRSVAVTFDDGAGGPNAGDVLSGQLAQLKAVTTGDIDMSVDPRGFYAVKGNTTKVQVDAKIPTVFSVRSPIFIAIPESEGSDRETHYSLEILLSMDVEEGKISFTLTCPSLERVLHEARLDAVGYLRALLGGDFLVGLGDLGTEVVAG